MNGMFRIRNLVEAIIIAIIMLALLSLFPYPSTLVKITVLLSVVGPVFMICLIGINDGSVIEFLMQFHKWQKSKRILLFNNNTNSRAVRPGDVMLSQELPRDKIVKMLDERKVQKRNNDGNRSLVEGRDFEFINDEDFNESFVKAEQKLLGVDESESQAKAPKRRKRLKKGKDLLMLSENNPIHDDNTDVADSQPDISDNTSDTAVQNEDNENPQNIESETVSDVNEETAFTNIDFDDIGELEIDSMEDGFNE